MARIIYQVTQDKALLASCRDESDAQALLAIHPDAIIETYTGWIGVIRDGGHYQPPQALIDELIADGLIEPSVASEE